MSSDLRDLWSSAGGQVPIDWEFKTIEELLEHSKAISVGVMYPGDHSDGGIPLIKVADVKNGLVVAKPEFCISEKVDEEYKRTRLNGTELLITLVGNPGDCVVVTDEMSGWNAARAIAVVRLKDIELRAWLRYVLLSKPAKHLIETRLNTTVQKTLNLKDIRELGIPVPPLSIRKKITSVIDGIEWKIQLNRQINQTLEQMAQAIFQSWFVDFEPVKAKISAREDWLARQAAQSDAHDDAPQFSSPVCYAHEFADATAAQSPAEKADLETFMNRAAMCAISGKTDADLDAMPVADYQRLYHTASLFPDELVESELGEIPKGWEVGSLKSLCVRIESGGTPKRTEPNYWGGDVKWLTSGEVRESLVFDTKEKISLDGLSNSSAKLWPKYTTVIAMYGATGGQVCLLLEEMTANQACCGLIPYDYSASFLYMNSLSASADLASKASGSAQQNLNKGLIESHRVLNPDLAVLSVFQETVGVFFSESESLVRSIQVLSDIRDSLLPKLLSGELDISALTELADNAAESGATHD